MSDLQFAVSASSESPARVRVATRQFTMTIDEPPELGGQDQGANPVEYLLAALAGCLNVVAHLVAREQGIALRGLTVNASGEVNPDRLLNVPTTDRAGFKGIRVELGVDTDASPEALAQWRQVVESRCPVSDNLNQPTPVTIEVVHRPKSVKEGGLP
ncbi:MAG: OsmC family protein [Candidatus Latescibacterota bacterium]|jgi:uncharacterized OsmC-like protein